MNLFGLTGDSPFDPFISFLEKVLLLQIAVQGQQPIHGGAWFSAPPSARMCLTAMPGGALRHEQGAVALFYKI